MAAAQRERWYEVSGAEEEALEVSRPRSLSSHSLGIVRL
jgi:hypothetical protein